MTAACFFIQKSGKGIGKSDKSFADGRKHIDNLKMEWYILNASSYNVRYMYIVGYMEGATMMKVTAMPPPRRIPSRIMRIILDSTEFYSQIPGDLKARGELSEEVG